MIDIISSIDTLYKLNLLLSIEYIISYLISVMKFIIEAEPQGYPNYGALLALGKNPLGVS